MTPLIETPRMRLRSWTQADFDPWARLNADPRVMEFFLRTYDRDESVASAQLIQVELEHDGYGWFVAEVKDRFPFAGVIALQDIPFQAKFTPAYEIGWRFLPEAWGYGYATEGARAALDLAFNRLGWREVVAMTAKINLRSQRVMERLGMTYDPTADFEHPKIPEGHRLRPHVLYRIARG
ncbi:MAG TPA: GNAT family N-acetyltransferase [Candidatus Baltobacteraceae bacterium]|jgi:ribosomal-protein-alanine N-acetyltransferase